MRTERLLDKTRPQPVVILISKALTARLLEGDAGNAGHVTDKVLPVVVVTTTTTQIEPTTQIAFHSTGQWSGKSFRTQRRPMKLFSSWRRAARYSSSLRALFFACLFAYLRREQQSLSKETRELNFTQTHKQLGLAS